jgi:hypothetical protein
MPHNTKKNKKHMYKSHTYKKRHTDYAKRATTMDCTFKNCNTKKYQSVYGGSAGGRVRGIRTLYY